ncbi:MAG TPA: O-antigen ligase family protein [Nitrospira sp.]|nr:O-antigen ligase family protein [Nitrospira sp.]
MPVVDDLPTSVDHSPLDNIQSVSRSGISASSVLAFATGMFVQLSMPLTDLYEVPNVRGVFFGLILGIFAFRFLSGESLRTGGALLISYLVLSLVLALGITYSRAPVYGTAKVILVCSYFWLLGTVIYNLVDDVTIGKAFLTGLFVGGLLLIGVVVIEFGNPMQLFRNTNRFFRLRFGDDGNPIMLGRHLALAITIIATFVAVRRRWKDLVWSIPVGLLTLVYLVATGSKGPLLALALCFVVTALLMMRGVMGRLSLSILLVGLFSVIGVVGVEFLPKGFIEERFTEKVQNLSLRMPAYQDVMRTLLESDATQMLVGHGTGDYGYFALGHDERAYPHNVLLEVAYENGLIGIGLLVAALSCPLVAVIRAAQHQLEYQHRMLLAGLSAAYISSIINAQFTGDLGANLLIGMFGAATASMSNLRVSDPL